MSNWEGDKYPKVRRDNQRLKEYRSEWALVKKFPEELMNNAELVTYLRTITHDSWFIARFGTVTFSICFSRRRKRRASCKRRYASCGLPTYSLHFPDNNQNSTLLALHELCHVLCWAQSHGPIFCSVLLQVVTHYMGVTAGKELRRQFGINMVELVR